jgi:hypothetical protein
MPAPRQTKRAPVGARFFTGLHDFDTDVIGLCNRWGHLMASNPELEMAFVSENCIALLINGFMDKVGSDRIIIDL